ncbi:MAG: hypothetical protein M3Q58_16360 [Bacteroidota bacterium]|nr:hypothetical protein [Bacteroidota bacterium]
MKSKISLLPFLLFLFLIRFDVVTSQTTTVGNNSIFSTDYSGWDASTTFDYNLKHEGNYNINFYTTNTQRMTITSGGLVGIGTTNPIHKLDINDGNINLITSTRGYMINKRFVLWHNGDASNIYVGQNAGNATATGSFNTFLGNRAGNLNTTGYQNTFTI